MGRWRAKALNAKEPQATTLRWAAVQCRLAAVAAVATVAMAAVAVATVAIAIVPVTTLGALPAAAGAIPLTGANGDYVRPDRRTSAVARWIVVDTDPTGLRCRMPRAFQGLAFDQPVPGDRRQSVGERLLVDRVHAIDRWDVAVALPVGTVLTAYGGNLGALILVHDTRGRPWLPVAIRGRACFVRAHRDLIQPF